MFHLETKNKTRTNNKNTYTLFCEKVDRALAVCCVTAVKV